MRPKLQSQFYHGLSSNSLWYSHYSDAPQFLDFQLFFFSVLFSDCFQSLLEVSTEIVSSSEISSLPIKDILIQLQYFFIFYIFIFHLYFIFLYFLLHLFLVPSQNFQLAGDITHLVLYTTLFIQKSPLPIYVNHVASIPCVISPKSLSYLSLVLMLALSLPTVFFAFQHILYFFFFLCSWT